MSGRLNAAAPVTDVASVNHASRRFGDVRVILENILHFDSNDSCAGHAVAAWPHHSVH